MLFKSLVNSALFLTGLTQAASSTASSSSSFPTIDVVGNKFFYSNNGSQFYVRGVAYQADVSADTNNSFIDPLADITTCKRDLPYLVKANTNVLRVYAIDHDSDHTECMNLFQENGIYIIADLAEPTLAIDTNDPSWDLDLYDRYTSIIDELQQYDNVLGFFAGNEVITNSTTSNAAPFVKAAVRDMKAYISDKGYRSIPVGYSANDDGDTRISSAGYFACGDDDIKADFYGINMYEWCGSSSFKTSGYEARTEEFSNLTIPIFFSEYGCNTVSPRKFTEIGTIFSDEMTDVWSGGIVYMYYEEANEYGLVSEIDSTSVKPLDDYTYYSSEMNAISPTSAQSSDVTAATSDFSCPATGADWAANTALPPTPESGVCDCMSASLSCIVSDDVDSTDYSDLFGIVCGLIDCTETGITADGETGTYGAYSFCSSKDKLSFILNLYFLDQDSHSSACDFSGSASLQTASTASSCSSVLAAAGSSGLGSVTNAPDSTESDSSSSSSGSGSGSASGSGSSSSASSSSSSSSSSGASGPAINVDRAVMFTVLAGVVSTLSVLFL